MFLFFLKRKKNHEYTICAAVSETLKLEISPPCLFSGKETIIEEAQDLL